MSNDSTPLDPESSTGPPDGEAPDTDHSDNLPEGTRAEDTSGEPSEASPHGDAAGSPGTESDAAGGSDRNDEPPGSGADEEATDRADAPPEDGVPPPPPPPGAPESPHSTGERPPLERRLDRRIVAGVAAGLGDHWGISPTWIRLGFAVLTAFGFLGVFLYLAAWVLIPPNDGTESIADDIIRRIRGGESWVGAALIALAALIVIGSLDFVPGDIAFAVALFVLGYILYRGLPTPRPPDEPDGRAPQAGTASISAESRGVEAGSETPPPGASGSVRLPRRPRPPKPPSWLNRAATGLALLTIGGLATADIGGARIEIRHYLATVMAIVAGALIVGAWRGRARLLIVPGLLLALPTFVFAFTSLTFDTPTVVDLRIAPQTAADIEAQYRFDAGDLTLDLSAVRPLPDREVTIDVDAGEVTVILPASGAALVESRVGVGSITDVAHTEGLSLHRRVSYRGDGPQLRLSITLDAGEVQIVREGT